MRPADLLLFTSIVLMLLYLVFDSIASEIKNLREDKDYLLMPLYIGSLGALFGSLIAWLAI